MKKKCTKCLIIQPIENYAKHTRYRGGRLTWCKHCVYLNRKKWVKENREHYLKKSHEYGTSEKHKVWRRKYRKENVEVKLSERMRARLYCFLKSNGIRKHKKTADLMGCSWKELRMHIESQFQPGMSWDNWGLHTWHIDHIKPLNAFKKNYTKGCHFSNLQPLWAADNNKKRAKY